MDAPVLLIEDTLSLQMVYKSVLRNAGHQVICADTAMSGLEHFQKAKPCVILLDLSLPDRDGLALMTECLSERPDACFIVITANGSINRAVQAMRAGAYEFLVKPFDEQRLLGAIKNAKADIRRARTLKGTELNHAPLKEFIGSSVVMRDVYAKIRSVSQSMATVFISGESGTGKELCAQAVHDQSSRASGPFIPLNCGAIPSDLLESEVFGHLKGSFTGAIADKPGAAAAADGGTLFLDEICEMDLNLQTKLLRFLQTSTIQPVGSATARKVNVRILCATNRDPVEEVRQGRFRQDLFYRLHVVPIHLPTLHERENDVLEVAEAALRRFSQEEGRAFTALSDDVKQIFLAHTWPGNVRQLLNVMRNVVVLNDGPMVTKSMLPTEMHQPPLRPTAPAQNRPATGAPEIDALIGKTLAEIEEIIIEQTIAHHGGSVPKAAHTLDVSPSTIYRKREIWKKRQGRPNDSRP